MKEPSQPGSQCNKQQDCVDSKFLYQLNDTGSVTGFIPATSAYLWLPSLPTV